MQNRQGHNFDTKYMTFEQIITYLEEEQRNDALMRGQRTSESRLSQVIRSLREYSNLMISLRSKVRYCKRQSTRTQSQIFVSEFMDDLQPITVDEISADINYLEEMSLTKQKISDIHRLYESLRRGDLSTFKTNLPTFTKSYSIPYLRQLMDPMEKDCDLILFVENRLKGLIGNSFKYPSPSATPTVSRMIVYLDRLEKPGQCQMQQRDKMDEQQHILDCLAKIYYKDTYEYHEIAGGSVGGKCRWLAEQIAEMIQKKSELLERKMNHQTTKNKTTSLQLLFNQYDQLQKELSQNLLSIVEKPGQRKASDNQEFQLLTEQQTKLKPKCSEEERKNLQMKHMDRLRSQLTINIRNSLINRAKQLGQLSDHQIKEKLDTRLENQAGLEEGTFYAITKNIMSALHFQNAEQILEMRKSKSQEREDPAIISSFHNNSFVVNDSRPLKRQLEDAKNEEKAAKQQYKKLLEENRELEERYKQLQQKKKQKIRDLQTSSQRITALIDEVNRLKQEAKSHLANREQKQKWESERTLLNSDVTKFKLENQKLSNQLANKQAEHKEEKTKWQAHTKQLSQYIEKLQSEKRNLESQKRNLQSEKTQLSRKLAEITGSNAGTQTRLQEQRRKNQQKITGLTRQFQGQKKKLQQNATKISELTQQLQIKSQELTSIQQQTSKTQSQLKQLNQQLQQAQQQAQQSKQSLQEANKQKDEAADTVKSYEEFISKLFQELPLALQKVGGQENSDQKGVEHRKSVILEYLKEVNNAQQKQKDYLKEIKKLKEDNKDMKEKLQKLMKNIKKLKQEKPSQSSIIEDDNPKAKQDESQKLSQKNKELEGELKNIQQQKVQLLEKNTKLETQIIRLTEECRTKQSEISKLKEEKMDREKQDLEKIETQRKQQQDENTNLSSSFKQKQNQNTDLKAKLQQQVDKISELTQLLQKSKQQKKEVINQEPKPEQPKEEEEKQQKIDLDPKLKEPKQMQDYQQQTETQPEQQKIKAEQKIQHQHSIEQPAQPDTAKSEPQPESEPKQEQKLQQPPSLDAQIQGKKLILQKLIGQITQKQQKIKQLEEFIAQNSEKSKQLQNFKQEYDRNKQLVDKLREEEEQLKVKSKELRQNVNKLQERAYKASEDEIKKREATCSSLADQIASKSAEVKQLQANRAQFTKQLNELKKNCEASKKQLSEADAQIKKDRDQAEKLKAGLLKLKKMTSEAEATYTKKLGESLKMEERQKKASAGLKTAETQTEKLKKQQESIIQLMKSLDESKSTKARLDQEIETCRQTIEALNKQEKLYQRQIAHYKFQLEEYGKKVSEIDQNERRLGDLIKRQQQTEEQFKDIQAKIVSSKKQEKACQERLANAQKQCERKQKLNNELLSTLQTRVKQARQKLRQHEDEIAKVKEGKLKYCGFPNRFFVGETLDHECDREFILSEIEKKHPGRQILRTKLLFSYPLMGTMNPHCCVDEIPNYVMILKMKAQNTEGKNYVIAMYSQNPLSMKSFLNTGVGFIASVTNQRAFHLLKSQNNKPRISEYNEYFFVFGNSELRIRFSSDELESNVGHLYKSFDTEGYKRLEIFTGQKEEKTSILVYEVYQVIFKQEGN